MISTITAPAHTVTPAAPRENECRSLLAAGVTIGTIHEAGTSSRTGQERRSRAMISPAGSLSTAAPSSLHIPRAYGEPSSTRQSCNPWPTFRREELGRARPLQRGTCASNDPRSTYYEHPSRADRKTPGLEGGV